MAFVTLDVENRLEKACKELWDDLDELVDLVTAARIVVGHQKAHDADYPCAYLEGGSFREDVNRIGWYMGNLSCGACSFRTDDKSNTVVKSILGVLRGWAQQDDLVAQINGTASASADGSEVTCTFILLEEPPVDFSGGQLNEWVLPVGMLVRPSHD